MPSPKLTLEVFLLDISARWYFTNQNVLSLLDQRRVNTGKCPFLRQRPRKMLFENLCEIRMLLIESLIRPTPEHQTFDQVDVIVERAGHFRRRLL